MLSQIPGGALRRRGDLEARLGGGRYCGDRVLRRLLLAVSAGRGVRYLGRAESCRASTAGIITPAIGAISLGLVGRSAMAVRTGRNLRYAAVGHALTGALMGVAGAYIGKGAIFVAAARCAFRR